MKILLLRAKPVSESLEAAVNLPLLACNPLLRSLILIPMDFEEEEH